MLLALLTIMVAAFMEVYRSHYALSRASNASIAAGAACDAVYQYVSYRLEHDRSWGATKFSGDEGENSGDEGKKNASISIKTIAGSQDFKGEIPDLNASFTATITNDLSNPSSPNAYCQVTATCGDSTRQLEFLLAQAPLFESSLQTRADIDITDSQSLRFSSTDDNRNFVRAEGDITVPGLIEGNTQFVPRDGSDRDERGLLWSKSNIMSWSAGDKIKIDEDPDDFKNAADNSLGKVIPHGESHFPLLDINENNLLLPGNTNKTNLEVNGKSGGRWVFVKRLAKVSYEAKYSYHDNNEYNPTPNDPPWGVDKNVTGRGSGWAWTEVLEYYDNPDAKPYQPDNSTSIPSKIYRAANRKKDIRSIVENSEKRDGLFVKDKYNYDLEEDSIKVTGIEIPAYKDYGKITDPDSKDTTQLIEIVEDGVKSYGGGLVRFDLTEQEVTVQADTLVKVDNGFCVESTKDETDYKDFITPKVLKDKDGNPVLDEHGNEEMYYPTPAGNNETQPPRLDLGYKQDKGTKGEVIKATIQTDQGNIEIKEGITDGLGSLIASKGDVIIQPKGTNLVDVDSKLDGVGLLVYAGNNIELKNPNGADNWNFRGLVYAGNSITMDGNGAQNVFFEGSVATANAKTDQDSKTDPPKGINIKACKNLEFRYNSKLLDAYVKQLGSGRIQLETVYWKR